MLECWLSCGVCSIGLSLVYSLYDLVQEGRIEPQLAMRVVSRFDKAAAEVLAEKVKARLNFKVRFDSCPPYFVILSGGGSY